MLKKIAELEEAATKSSAGADMHGEVEHMKARVAEVEEGAKAYAKKQVRAALSRMFDALVEQVAKEEEGAMFSGDQVVALVKGLLKASAK